MNEFENHVATYSRLALPNGGLMEWLQWKNPNSSNYAIWYVRYGGFLCVFGDAGDAVFQWHEVVSLEFIANCSLDYFEGKCQASPYGRRFRSWDEETAKERLTEFFAEEENAGLETKFEDAGGWGAIDNQFAWDCWCDDNAHDVFGQYWWDSDVTGSPGLRIDSSCELMLRGLKEAMKRCQSSVITS